MIPVTGLLASVEDMPNVGYDTLLLYDHVIQSLAGDMGGLIFLIQGEGMDDRWFRAYRRPPRSGKS